MQNTAQFVLQFLHQFFDAFLFLRAKPHIFIGGNYFAIPQRRKRWPHRRPDQSDVLHFGLFLQFFQRLVMLLFELLLNVPALRLILIALKGGGNHRE